MSTGKKDIASGQSPTTCGGKTAIDRILVVDDNTGVLHVLNNMLHYMGYSVDIAHGGEEAQLKIIQNNYNIVLADLDMPDLDGLNLGFWIRQRSPTTRVVIMTGRCRLEVVGLKNSSAFDWIFKPFRLHELRLMLDGFS